ncbi:MAG: hypothetical protein M3294_00040 [Pseudomonadota bacterium]|nr:hypothetical protein [Pseudomonadota bacterium]
MDGTQFSKHDKTIGLLNGDGDGPGFFLQVEGASVGKNRAFDRCIVCDRIRTYSQRQQKEGRMKLSIHPISLAKRPVRLFILVHPKF